jgi:hypothetical protein
VSDDRIEQSLGRAISLRVPNNFSDVIRAINSGTPIGVSGKSPFGAAIQKWTRELTFTGSENGVGMQGTAASAPVTGLRALFAR